MKAQPWRGYLPPFKLWGPVYFVGTMPASSHLIDTGDGLILLDSGYPETLYLVLEGIREMGFDPHDIKYILHSHGHFDHMGGTPALVHYTGAKTILGERDREMVNGTGKVDLSWAKELGYTFDNPFEPDILLKDGDVFTLGNISIQAINTPGHTAGTMSFFFEAEGKRFGMMGGAGVNSMTKEWLTSVGLPLTCRDDFFASLDRLSTEKVDVTLGNHTVNNDHRERFRRYQAGDKDAFLDPEWWPQMLVKMRKALEDQIASEN